jgi:hypothetical protein
MKGLQNSKITNDDKIDMEDIISKTCEDENVLIIENNASKKAKENKIKMLAKAMKVHELLRKKLI